MLSFSRLIAFVAVLSLGFLLHSDIVLAQDTGAQTSRPWWENVEGILAIPVLLVGLIYSWALLKKNRLEMRKIELEILEKERGLSEHLGRQDPVIQEVMQPLLANRNVQFLILRFIVLYLVLAAWGLVGDVVGVLVQASSIFNIGNSWLWIPFQVLINLPNIGYWLLFFVIGWPLFKDISQFLGLELKEFFKLRKVKSD
jgi:hypothetical protein